MEDWIPIPRKARTKDWSPIKAADRASALAAERVSALAAERASALSSADDTVAPPGRSRFMPPLRYASPAASPLGAPDAVVMAKLWLASLPLMEVAQAPSHSNDSTWKVRVTETCELDSALRTELRPYTRLHAIASSTLSNGTRRVQVVLEGANKPLGWLTPLTASGSPVIHIYARPMYEVVTPPKIRKNFDLSSKFVTQCAPRELERNRKQQFPADCRSRSCCEVL